MSPHDDDLTGWETDPVVAALTAPGTETELAGEADALAAFRAAVPKRSHRRFIGRLGVGGAAVTTAVIFSSGAAAAYTSSLPQPVQNFISHVTNPLGLGVPEKPSSHKPTNSHLAAPLASTPPAAPTSPLTGAPSPTAQRHGASPRPAHHSTAPSHEASPAASPAPVVSATATATPTSSPAPTITATPPGVGSITISLSATSVAVNGTVTVAGQLANPDGSPIAGAQVSLMERAAGTPGFAQVAAGTTQADGRVSLTTPPISHSVRLRLITDSKVRSASIGVRLQATIMATVGHQGPAGSNASIQIATTGAAPGDSVTIEKRVGDGWQTVATNELDGSGSALFSVAPPTTRRDHYRAVLPHGNAHSGAATHFVVTAG